MNVGIYALKRTKLLGLENAILSCSSMSQPRSFAPRRGSLTLLLTLWPRSGQDFRLALPSRIAGIYSAPASTPFAALLMRATTASGCET